MEEMRALREEVKDLKRELEAAKLSNDSGNREMAQRESSDGSGEAAGSGTYRVSTTQHSTGTKPKKPTYRTLDMSQFRPDNYPKYHVVEVEAGLKRKLNPFKVFDDVKFAIKGEPEDLTSIGRDKFLITVRNKQQSEDIKKLKFLASVPCKVSGHQTMNTSKGIIYIREFDIGEEELRVGLQDQSVIEVVHATWIKGRNEWVKPFLLTFAMHATPEHVKIPGESFRTTVYEYHSRPMQCRKCQQYGHKDKKCTSDAIVCGKCAASGHQSNECTSDTAKCYHCAEAHFSWNKKCPENVFQSEVTKLQSKEKMSRRDAIQAVSRRFPERKTTYARRVVISPAPVEEQRNQSKRKLNQSSPTATRVIGEGNDSRKEGEKRRRAEEGQRQSEIEMEYEEEADILRQIYDSYVPNQINIRNKGSNSCKAVSLGTPIKKSSRNLNVGMIELTRHATECSEQVIQDLEKYKIARMYLVPSEGEITQALVMSEYTLPTSVSILNGQLNIPVTMMDDFSKQQMAELSKVLAQ